MYYQVISQCVQMLKNLESWLDKAEEHAAAKKFDVGVLMAGRLAPDMKPSSTRSRALATMSKPGRPGSRDRRRPSTRTTSIQSTRYAPASGRPSISRRA